LRYLSLFSGIEAATVAWHPLGWEPVAFAEVERFPSAVLAHHYPSVPNLGDVTQITDSRIAALGQIDLVVGGSPCQDLSVAGKRAGLGGERSSLFHQQIRIFHAARHFCGARWLLWENVPGAFSSNQGRDFATVVNSMAGCRLNVPNDGWGSEGVALGQHGLVEWSVLDAQWFGLAQRRRRVFVVLDTGNWADREPILLERDGLRGDTPPSRHARQDTAPTLASHARGGGGLGTDFDCDGGLIAFGGNNSSGPIRVSTTLQACSSVRLDWESETFVTQVSGALNANGKAAGSATQQDAENGMLVVHTLRGEGFDASEDGTGRGTPLVPVYSIQAGAVRENPASGPNGIGVQADLAYTIEARAEVQAIAFPANLSGTQCASAEDLSPSLGAKNPTAVAYGFQPRIARNGRGDMGEVVSALNAQSGETGKGDAAPCVALGSGVRRLTPRECERLQGFQDDYTAVPWRGKPADQCTDGPRYKSLGNSMAVPVMRWIGLRIAQAEALPARQPSERSLEMEAA
jgi:DNA (cytosine-5)-methyltransferase 1